MNAVDDPANASVYLGGVVAGAGLTLGISTDGAAPALAGLLREALDAHAARRSDVKAVECCAHTSCGSAWRARGVPMEARRPELLEALNALYESARAGVARSRSHDGA